MSDMNKDDSSTPAQDPTIGRPSMILDVVVRAEYHALLVASIWLLFIGHNLPGGGFIGGLVAVSAFGLRLAAGGVEELRKSLRVKPEIVVGLGLLVAAGTAIAGLFNGGSLLESRELHVDLPVIGDVATSTAFFFDLGVYLVVVGSFLWLLDAMSAPEESEPTL